MQGPACDAYLALRVDEDDHLIADGDRLVEIAQRVQLPLLTLDIDFVLLDAFLERLVGGWAVSFCVLNSESVP